MTWYWCLLTTVGMVALLLLPSVILVVLPYYDDVEAMLDRLGDYP